MDIEDGDVRGQELPPPPEVPKPKRWPIVVAVGVVLLVVIGGGVAFLLTRDSGNSDHELVGSMTLKRTYTGNVGAPCIADGPYSDLEGADVKVTDGSGKILAKGDLGSGKQVKAPDASNNYCEFPFLMDGPLPKADFYTVEVGRRGELTYSYDEMVFSDWTVRQVVGQRG